MDYSLTGISDPPVPELKRLIPQPLTASAFAPFGDLIQVPDDAGIQINEGSAIRHDDLSRADTNHELGTTGLSLFVAQPRALPITIRMLERHPLGSQAFMPLDGQAFVIVVAPASESGQAGEPVAFLARPEQGINFARGVWHHPLIALASAGRFLVIDRIGPGENLETIQIEPRSLDLIS